MGKAGRASRFRRGGRFSGGESVGIKDSDADATRLGDTDPGAEGASEFVTDATPRGATLPRATPPPRGALSQATTELVGPASVVQKAPPDLRPGTTLFGAYEILDKLGAGGMGEVYRARHLSLGGLRAIKVMHPELAHRSDALARFHAEARALLDVHHPAVVGCHDLLRDDAGRVYLVMEMVEGVSLLERIHEQPLTQEEIVKLGLRIAEGLDAAHACGVIHRDLSPDNILLPQGKVEQAKIIDFGIAKALAAGEETISEGFKGKLAYASPEQLGFFGGHVDARSDLYSLGLVLCAAANGAPLAMGTNLKEAVDARQAFRGPPEIPPMLRREIAPLLALNPADRPASARQTFASWRGGEPLALPRSRTNAPLLAVAVAALLAFAYWAWLRTSEVETVAPVAPSAREAAPVPTAESEEDLIAALQPPPGAEKTSEHFASLRSWLVSAPGSDASLAPKLSVTPNPVYAGSTYRVTMAANCNCYPLLFSVTGDGTEIDLLYPNPYDGLERVQPGKAVTIPASDYEFEAVGDVSADELRLIVVDGWPDFPPASAGFWSATWLLPEGGEQLAALRARLEGMRWAAVGVTLEIAR